MTSPRATIEQVHDMAKGRTVPMEFVKIAAERPDAVLLRSMASAPGAPEASWNTWTLGDVRSLAARAAAGYQALDVEPGERVMIMMRNRPDFHWLDLGAQFVRATPVSIYNSSSAEEIQYLASHAEARIMILEDAGFLAKVMEIRDELPLVEHIFVLEAPTDGLPDGVRLVDELLANGEADLDTLAEVTSPDDLATLIYTSGTTGPPKGVMVSQYNVIYAINILREVLDEDDIETWRAVSYLPMAHIAERVTTHYQAMVIGFEVTCCPDPALLSAYLREVHPLMLFGVPRVFEKIYAGVNAALSMDPEKAKAFNDGVAAAIEIKRAERAGTITDEQRETLAFLDAVAFAQVRALVGLDEIRIAITGAAPLPAEILEWFNAIGINLAEIYGLSETTGPLTFSPKANKPGYVGQACPGMEVKLGDDGEVLTRGGNVFHGYLKAPDKTAEALIDGWFHTGDIGILDDEGYLKIVDRKKELIITSGGKNISPANLEAALKMIPVIGQACTIGDNRKYLSALLVLDPEATPVWAAANGKEGMSLADLATDPEVIAMVQAGVDEVNTKFAQVEQIKKFTLLGEEWMPDSDLLTPTSKLKRRGIHARYAAEIEAMYDGA
ncbi:MAG: AMP-binding protein [Actinomycetota bacterium]|jgi:long-chain acyl-CoA synthetase|nr:AMP-binding protein [Actinomycetota bacterium]MDA3029439.1 AMP-binding protein [Actinomycetota bacterium]